jgi:hypothetical protein
MESNLGNFSSNLFKEMFNTFFTKVNKERRVIRIYTGVAGYKKIKQIVKNKQTIRRWLKRN